MILQKKWVVPLVTGTKNTNPIQNITNRPIFHVMYSNDEFENDYRTIPDRILWGSATFYSNALQ